MTTSYFGFGTSTDLTDGQFGAHGTLSVIRAVSTRPPRYAVLCRRCGSTGNLTQTQIQNMKFSFNVSCFKEQEHEERYPKQPAYEPTPCVDPNALTIPGRYPDF